MGGRRRHKSPGREPMPFDKKKVLERVRGLLILGANIKQICNALGISVMTLRKWRGEYAKLDALLVNKALLIDAEVTNSLFKRAKGYSKTAIKMFYDKTSGIVVKEEYREHIPPDTNAIKFYLSNRQPDKFKDRTTTDNNVSGSVAHNIQWEPAPDCDDIQPMTDETLDNAPDSQ